MSNIEIARNQRDCHAQQVSGVWSINGKEFCDKITELPNLYQEALDYQIEQEYELQDEYLHEQLARLEKELGSLTEEQIDNYRADHSADCINDDGYSYYFWKFVVQKMEDNNVR